jgi:hypothetical protein
MLKQFYKKLQQQLIFVTFKMWSIRQILKVMSVHKHNSMMAHGGMEVSSTYNFGFT